MNKLCVCVIMKKNALGIRKKAYEVVILTKKGTQRFPTPCGRKRTSTQYKIIQKVEHERGSVALKKTTTARKALLK